MFFVVVIFWWGCLFAVLGFSYLLLMLVSLTFCYLAIWNQKTYIQWLLFFIQRYGFFIQRYDCIKIVTMLRFTRKLECEVECRYIWVIFVFVVEVSSPSVYSHVQLSVCNPDGWPSHNALWQETAYRCHGRCESISYFVLEFQQWKRGNIFYCILNLYIYIFEIMYWK